VLEHPVEVADGLVIMENEDQSKRRTHVEIIPEHAANDTNIRLGGQSQRMQIPILPHGPQMRLSRSIRAIGKTASVETL
jgi:hypothetical protein